MPSRDDSREVDVAVVGAGQSGLALGYYLQRHDRRAPEAERVSFVLLDDRAEPGGAWSDGWDTLSLFSPATYSSLAGWQMPPWRGAGTPSAAHVAAYLRDYERRYDLPVVRGQRVTDVTDVTEESGGARLVLRTEGGTTWRARVVVSATGSWSRPFWGTLPGAETFTGTQVHTASYRSAAALPGRRVLVVGGGNSGAQVAADLLLHSDGDGSREVVWATREPPRMLPDDVDGRVLFEVATRAARARSRGEDAAGVGGLGDVVAVPTVQAARDEHGLHPVPLPTRLTATAAVWEAEDSSGEATVRDVDTIVWCTGFRPDLRHLRHLGLRSTDGHPRVEHPTVHGETLDGAAVAVDDDRVFFLGYGDWCAPASATLIGVNRAARDTAAAASAARGSAQSVRRG